MKSNIISPYEMSYDKRLDVLFAYFKKYKPELYKYLQIENSYNCKRGFGLYLYLYKFNNKLVLNSYGIPHKFNSNENIKLELTYNSRENKRNCIKILEGIVSTYYESIITNR